MIKLKSKNAIAFIATALAVATIGTARGGYVATPGAPGGGQFIVGTGSLDALSSTSTPPLSVGGNDQITINPNSTAISSTANDTIQLSGPNNILLNSGTIKGADGTIAGGGNAGFNAVSASSSGQNITNNSLIAGGAGDVETIGGSGILFGNAATLSNMTVNNNDRIIGGAGGNTNGSNPGGTGGVAFQLAPTNNAANITLNNNGTMTGGQGGAGDAFDDAGNGGQAVLINTSNTGGTINNVTITNSNSITGGAGGMVDATNGNNPGEGGSGIEISASANSTISNISIANGINSTISGGVGGDIINGNGQEAGRGGRGIYIHSANSTSVLSGISITNSAGGTIAGANGWNETLVNQAGGRGGFAISLESDGTLASVLINNAATGKITAGNGGNSSNQANGASGGYAISAISDSGDINGFALNNSGLITGGLGGQGDEGNNYSGNSGGYGLYVYSQNGNILNVNVSNSGSVIGGDGGNRSSGDSSIYMEANTSVSNVQVVNSGILKGGSGGASVSSSGGNGFNGIRVIADSNDITNVGIVNSGLIQAGKGGGTNTGFEGGDGGNGIELDASKNIDSVSLNNTGTIIGGDAGAGGTGDEGGMGVYVVARSNNLTNFSIINSGTIKGGGSVKTGGGFGNNAIGTALALYASKDINQISLKNSGAIVGGDGAHGANLSSVGVGIYSSGGNVANVNLLNTGNILGGVNASNGTFDGSGVAISSNKDLSNILIVNLGNITGGSGASNGFGFGNGIDLRAGTTSSNLSIINLGTISGGNANAGVESGNGIFSTASNLTISNLGAISTGSGLTPAAIVIKGSNNTVNLEGHSSTNGLIMAKGNVDSNKLNLNFTGVSPAVIASIKSLLTAEGVLNGHDSSGFFTLREVTYTWDPLVIGFNLKSYQLQAATPNQGAIGANLDSLTFNPTPGSSLFNFLNAIDQSGNVPLALEELSPQRYQIFGDIAVSTVNFMTLEIDHRLNNLRDGSESIDTMGMGGDTDKTTSAGYSKDGKNVEVPEMKSMQKRWGFFGSGSGLFANVDGHGGDLSDAYFSTSGLILGVDGKVTDHLVMGLLFNYNHTEAELDTAGSTARVDTYGGGVYSGYHNGGWYGNGLATYGHNNYDSKRNISFTGFNQTATGSTNGNQYAVNIDGGYDFHVCDKVTVGPLAGLQYVHLNVDGFNESGAGAGTLAVGSQSMDSLRSRIGVRANYHTQLAKEVAFATEIRAAWQHEFLDNSRGIDGSFIGSGLGSFTVQTTNPQRDAALVGVGVNFTVRDTMTVFFDYDVQAGQESYLEHSIKGGLKFSF